VITSRRKCRLIVLTAIASAWVAGAASAQPTATEPPDSLLNGILIGAAVGAVPGIYWLVADPNECTGMCAEEYALIGIGALVGGLIDRAITRKATVYSTEGPSGRARTVHIGALAMRNRKGVRVAIRF